MKIMFRALLYTIGILILTQGAYSQQTNKSEESKTKLESFQAKTGSVVIKSYSSIGGISGRLGSVQVDALELRDATSGLRVLGITINVKESARLEREDTSFIDYDEIDSLIKGIDYVSKVSSPTETLSNFEARYKTRGDFSIVTFNGSDGVSAAVTSGSIGRARAYISLDELQKLRQVLTDAKTKLDAIRPK